MEKKSLFIILPDSLLSEFIEQLAFLEQLYGVKRHTHNKEKGNKYNMIGNTTCLEYSQGGKYSAFKKEISTLWTEFNKKYPKTSWNGK
jgi:hypothetical protein